MISNDITYWVLNLKTYCANFANDMAKKEAYAIDECDDCWLQVIWATHIISLLECYTIGSDTCLVYNDIYKLLQQASKIINSKGGCN